MIGVRSLPAGVFLLLLLFITGCDHRVFPPVDVGYSEFLSVLGENYKAIAGSQISTTVGVVQIFSGIDRRNLVDLAEATGGQILFESRQRDVIDRLISAIQQEEKIANPSCNLAKAPPWVLVAYDSGLFRAGVIRLYECGEGAEMVVGVRPVGDTGIMYSREAAAMLRSFGLVGANRLLPPK